MPSKKIKRKCFTFLWKLENISYCLQKKGEVITSPTFVVGAKDQTKWKLELYPRGERDGKCIGYFLYKHDGIKDADEIKMEYQLAFMSKEDSVLKESSIAKTAFGKHDAKGFPTFETRENVFTLRRSEYLPQDTLRARCRIWKSVVEMTEDVRCTAHTRIRVEKRNFMWNLINFSTIEPENKCTYQIKSIENDAILMTVDLSLTGGLSGEEIIRFELSLQDQTIKFSTLQLYLIDASGNKVECNHDEFWFDNLVKCKQFTFFFTKKKLLAKKSIYLPDDILSLHWEWAFSKGVVLEEIEEVQYGTATSENKILDLQNVSNEKTVSLTYTLEQKLKSFYDKQFLCDITLKTDTGIFPAHKLILSASSSVFNAMFSNDMKEKNSDCVNIQDLSDDTISRMLLYIYTSNMEDATWESVSHLYVAADKYAILSLKNICCSYLKNNLSPSNACEILLLSDIHADGELKQAVQDYVLKHDKDIINSDEWKLLMENNGRLAAETLCLRYK